MFLTILAILLKLTLVAVAIAAPAWMLQASCSVCGEEVPGFGLALLAGLTAGITTAIVGVVYTWTIGWAIGMFFSVLAARVIGGVMAWTITTIAYSAFLRIGMMQAAQIALVQHVLAIGIAIVLGAIGLPLFF